MSFPGVAHMAPGIPLQLCNFRASNGGLLQSPSSAAGILGERDNILNCEDWFRESNNQLGHLDSQKQRQLDGSLRQEHHIDHTHPIWVAVSWSSQLGPDISTAAAAMLPSRTSVSVRRAARCVLQTAAANARPQKQSPPLPQRRYAIAVPTFRRKPLNRPTPSSEGGLLFKTSDIPPIDVWADYKSQQGLGELTPEDGLKTVINYCDVATKDTPSWKATLERGMVDTQTQPMRLLKPRG